MISMTQQAGTKVNDYILGMNFWMKLKPRLPVSQKIRCSFRFCIVVSGAPCYHVFRLVYFFVLKLEESLFWQSCTRVDIQLVGAIEHNQSFNTDACCASVG